MAKATRSPVLGFNHNVRYHGRIYHVQTEDSGLAHTRVFTHLFFEGTIIASKRYDYAADFNDEGVKAVMQGQHKAILKELKQGLYDEKIISFFSSRGQDGFLDHIAEPAGDNQPEQLEAPPTRAQEGSAAPLAMEDAALLPPTWDEQAAPPHPPSTWDQQPPPPQSSPGWDQQPGPPQPQLGWQGEPPASEAMPRWAAQSTPAEASAALGARSLSAEAPATWGVSSPVPPERTAGAPPSSMPTVAIAHAGGGVVQALDLDALPPIEADDPPMPAAIIDPAPPGGAHGVGVYSLRGRVTERHYETPAEGVAPRSPSPPPGRAPVVVIRPPVRRPVPRQPSSTPPPGGVVVQRTVVVGVGGAGAGGIRPRRPRPAVPYVVKEGSHPIVHDPRAAQVAPPIPGSNNAQPPATISDKSLDEVILAYLSQDNEPKR